jgi:hypothetical protein
MYVTLLPLLLLPEMWKKLKTHCWNVKWTHHSVFLWRCFFTVVQNYRQQHVESGAYHAECERDTLFPTVKLQADHDSVAEGGSSSKKKQSVALVPKGISKSVQRFLPLFNKGLFPNKAPPATTANRMLFTDAEDE